MVFVEAADLEDSSSNAVRIERIQLDSTIAVNHEMAMNEAQRQWEVRLGKGQYEGWDQKTYPHSPSLGCDCPLS